MFCVFQRRDRAIFRLNGIASRLGVSAFRKFALRAVEKRFRGAKFDGRKLCSARLPGNGNSLPGVTHFLYRWPGSTTTQHDQQCENSPAPNYSGLACELHFDNFVGHPGKLASADTLRQAAL